MNLIKPPKLKTGDRVAAVSLSWGGAGDPELLWRYRAGKEYIERAFGLEVVEMPNTLKGSDWLYRHPEARAEDLMRAFADPSVKAVFSCIGGSESVRILPYIDYDVIRRNPKVFMGYSDTTVTHMICLKEGLSSFYGPSILAEFAENGGMHAYTERWVRKALFEAAKPLGTIEAPAEWTSEYVPWVESNRNVISKMTPNRGYELLQGKGVARGPLVGGCIEVLEMLKGTELWPDGDVWDGALLFFETSEDMPGPDYIEYWLRNYASQGILQHCAGILFGKPYGEKYYDEYKARITKVVAGELGLAELPVLVNVSFGHTAPMAVIPYGAVAELDCDTAAFRILEPGVI